MNPLSQIIAEWFQTPVLKWNDHRSPPTCNKVLESKVATVLMVTNTRPNTQRVREVLKSQLNGQNKIQAINTPSW